MKQILVELDDQCARDLERVAPAKTRKRAEFVRLAIRRAVDLMLDRETAVAYREQPFHPGLLAGDLEGWDSENALAKPALRASSKKATSRASRKRAA